MCPFDENQDKVSAGDLLEKLNKLQNANADYTYSEGSKTNEQNAAGKANDLNETSNIGESSDNKRKNSSEYGELIQKINTYQNNGSTQNLYQGQRKDGNYSPYDIYSSRKRLESNIEEAEQFVNENVTKKKHSDQVEMPLVDNIDNFVPESGEKKKGLFGGIFKKKEKRNKKDNLNQGPSIVDADGENLVDLDNDNVYVEELEDTAELIAFEPPIEAIESSTIADPDSHENNDGSLENSEAVMMMALGYKSGNNDTTREITLDNSETAPLDVTDAFGPTSTSLVDKMAREELQNENIEASSDKIRAIYKKLYKKHNSFKLRLIGVGILTLMLVIFEILAPILKWNIQVAPIINVVIDWVLVLFIAVICYDRVLRGFKQLFTWKLDVDVVLTLALLFSIVFTVVVIMNLSTYTGSEPLKLYNASFGVCAIFSLIAAILSSKRNIYSFRVASSKKEKKVIVPCEDDSISGKENQKFEVDNIKYINEFFANTELRAKSKKLLSIVVIIYLLISSVLLALLAFKGETPYTYVSSAYLLFSMMAPTSVFISYSYPAFRLSKKAYHLASAVLGEASVEEYDNAKTIVFDDVDAFPSEKTKLKTITIYKSDIDISQTIYYVSSVFSKVGGPLENVFKSATLESKISNDVQINTIEPNGIDAYVDGRRIIVGQPEYMRQQCFETVNDDEDISQTLTTNKRILYIACEEKVLAKFYIQYVTTKEFIRTVAYLNKANLKTIIRTTDPCIDDGLLENNRLNKSKYNISIVNKKEKSTVKEVVSAKKAGVITTGTTKNLIKTLSMCRNMPKLHILNLIIKIITGLLGVVLMTLYLFGGLKSNMLSVYPLLYQAFCAFIVYISSLIFI